MAAERVLRVERGSVGAALAVVRDTGNTQVLSSLSEEASAAGLMRDQPLRDARAMCPELTTRLSNSEVEAAFLHALGRWAGQFSPWIAVAPPEGIHADITGCAHLFGGEEALLAKVEADCARLRLTVQTGIADTLGAAWALARYAGQSGAQARSGDAIDQEAHATRSRAAKRRHWERGGAVPTLGPGRAMPAGRIALQGQTRAAIAALPVAALRLPSDTVAQLARLGLRRIDELAGQPRAGLARRFGQELVLRLDQALGVTPEPISPAAPPPIFAVRLTLPEPIGLEEDVVGGLDRLLPEFERRLRAKGQGAREVRFQVLRCDHTRQSVSVGLARPSAEPERLKPLLLMKIGEIDAGPGIDALRLEALVTEPVHHVQHRGHLNAAEDAHRRGSGPGADLDDLLGRLGARVGLESILRLHPADSHIPEKATRVLAAAWSEPARDWPSAWHLPRPLTLFRPEPVTVPDPGPRLGERFRWRRQEMHVARAGGPERIAPEWWLDEPEWRSGVRDYWRVETDGGARLWLFYAHGGTMSGGWFCQGMFG